LILQSFGPADARVSPPGGGRVMAPTNRPPSGNKSYFCKLYEDPTAIVCIAENGAERVFTFPISIAPELLEFITTGKATAAPREKFRLQLEDFNSQLEGLRNKAEKEIRITDIDLYKQILFTYYTCVAKYKDGIAMYRSELTP
jgi:hypothetical protein